MEKFYKERFNLNDLQKFKKQDCEESLMYLRYMLRRETSKEVDSEIKEYIEKVELRLKDIQDQ